MTYVKNMGKILLMSLRKVWISLYWFSKKLQILNSTGWRWCMPNAIQIGHSRNLFMPKAKMQLSSTSFHRYHACLTASCKNSCIQISWKSWHTVYMLINGHGQMERYTWSPHKTSLFTSYRMCKELVPTSQKTMQLH